MKHGVAIVGSGFASSILALILKRLGREVVLIEKGRHPRFALGESSTPLGNLCLERLAKEYDLPELESLATYGRWIESHADLRRGLKRGFTFRFHRPDQPFDPGAENQRRLLVAASPEDELADVHWLRADIDRYLAELAKGAGVVLLEGTEVVGIERDGAEFELRLETPAGPDMRRADFVVDGSGRTGVVAHHLGSELLPQPARFASGLVFSHFDDVELLEEAPAAEKPRGRTGDPYPEEQAAVHHMLEEGWLYSLRFDHGLTSAGLVWIDEPEGEAGAWSGTSPEEHWQHVVDRYPGLRRQFADARPVRPIERVPRLQYRRREASGSGWALLPHAYAFFEPLFSTGIAWSLLAVERLADLLGRDGASSTEAYGRQLALEADQIERLVYGAYLARREPEVFASQTFLYFAAVSFAETLQRMVPESQDSVEAGFLGAADPLWQRLFESAVDRLEASDREDFSRWIASSIERFNVAGLADRGRNNVYPADLDLVVANADKLGLSRREAERRLPLLRGQSVEP